MVPDSRCMEQRVRLQENRRRSWFRSVSALQVVEVGQPFGRTAVLPLPDLNCEASEMGGYLLRCPDDFESL